VTGGVEVRGSVLVLRAVAAADVAALQAHAQVHPPIALAQAFFAALAVRRHFGDLIPVSAGFRCRWEKQRRDN